MNREVVAPNSTSADNRCISRPKTFNDMKQDKVSSVFGLVFKESMKSCA